ncbi:hypothetical protein NW767_015652 [Fusarium falciforme]|nr:hypothetical protein NW767_015652 [Fusarium falciforme]
MAGDCLHEGMIFRWNIIDDDYDYFFNKLGEFIGKDKAGKILELYGIFSSTDPHEARLLIEELLGDVYFKIPNWLTLQASKLPESYGYHFDEISELTGPLKGTAHHCHDLLYLFMNKQEALTPEKQKLAQKMADAWITFANGEEPWTKFGSDHIWMTFGPNGVAQTKTDEEDEQVRRYKRFQAVLGLDCWLPLAEVVDEIACKRSLMGKN